MSDTPEHRKVVIIGSGPAGYTAGLYTSRALLEPLLFLGPTVGGQLTITTDVENYPGFADGVTGPEMVDIFRKQAERFGTTCLADTVESVDLSVRPFVVKAETTTVTCDTLIIATGADAKYLDLDSVHRLKNKGVSACATCDGFFFRDQRLAVVGGGDSAVEEATFLTRFATEVVLIHRRDELRASKIMAKRALENEKITMAWDTTVSEALGDEKLTGLRLKNLKTGEEREEEFGGLFMGIGHVPNTAFLGDQLAKDEAGYLLTKPGWTATEIPGVFACGDAADSYYRQAVTAAGTGCAAAIEAERWLEEQAG
ncbi:MAG: thioredoxin-disulfide reductase [Acidobacteriota bacterium]